jgi:DNA/RNA endonuclease G (NUC1)
MTNMMPQAPDNNRGVWKNLEEYGRRLVEQGYELYVIAVLMDKVALVQMVKLKPLEIKIPL